MLWIGSTPSALANLLESSRTGVFRLLSTSDSTPMYQQIVDQVTAKVIRGKSLSNWLKMLKNLVIGVALHVTAVNLETSTHHARGQRPLSFIQRTLIWTRVNRFVRRLKGRRATLRLCLPPCSAQP